MHVRSSSIMVEAYDFGLPGYQKTLVTENYTISNTSNVQSDGSQPWGNEMYCLITTRRAEQEPSVKVCLPICAEQT